MLTLNIAGGKLPPMPTILDDRMIPSYVINVDTSYYSETPVVNIEASAIKWTKDKDRISVQAFCNTDIIEFMERTILLFDRIVIYRFLEHVSFTQLDYFIYLVSTVARTGAMVDVIVPNYEVLAQRIINEEQRCEITKDFDKYDDFEGWNTELTTELLNEPSCPHASIWTPYRAKKFWEREKRFSVDKSQIDELCNFDGRNIYMRFFAQRV